MLAALSGVYCGLAPAPSDLWSRWTIDPVLIGALALLAAGYARAVRKLRIARTQQAAFAIGFIVLALALISPLCALSVSLFSARVGQHMVLTLVAAPLLALGAGDLLDRVRSAPPLTWIAQPLGAAGVFALFIWLWHMPAPYAATFENTGVYWLMHITLIASAIALWRALLRPAPARSIEAVFAGALSTVQMSLLGALLTLAVAPLFTPHLATAPAWGFSALEDQQIGGLLMWVPGGMAFLAAALAPMARLLRGDTAARV